MRKIVIASDSFKGSLSSAEVAEAACAGIHDIYPECEVRMVNMADGGEGMLEALELFMNASKVRVKVHDPLGRLIDSSYLIGNDGNTAIIEMAQASGLTLLGRHERNPLHTSSYGTGELILDGLRKGCRNFLIGIGGSATNDGGTGMLEALGFRFLDISGKEIHGCCGRILKEISYIDASQVDRSLRDSSFITACDVETVFTGPDGATHVFATQKGADSFMIEELEKGMMSFAGAIERQFGIDINEVKGSGAAGGIGGAMHIFLGAELKKGAGLVLDTVGFDDMIQDADLVITGEGRIDSQTFMGKGPAEVAARAKRYGVQAIAIGGIIEIDTDISSLFAAMIPASEKPRNTEELAEAMNPATAKVNIRKAISGYLAKLS